MREKTKLEGLLDNLLEELNVLERIRASLLDTIEFVKMRIKRDNDENMR